MTHHSHITDAQRVEFLTKLLADMRGKNGLVLPPWENEFVLSFNRFPRVGWFTPGGRESIDRRNSTDKIWMRYGPDIHWPHPADTVTERPKMAEADADGCEYIVKDEETARQRRCNDPAEFREPGRLRYCKLHAEAVELAMKRAKKSFCLIKFP